MAWNSTNITPTTFQQAVLRFRGWAGIVDCGGRGAGKSFCMLLDALSHTQELGSDARVLILRESGGGLQELMDESYSLCVAAFGSTVNRNKNAGTLECPNGAVWTFAVCDDVTTYSKLQGRSFTGCYFDEIGNYSPDGFQFAMKCLSNLRAPLGMRTAIHMTMNPHGRAHQLCWTRWVSKSPAWLPYTDEFGLRWVNCHGTLKDNPHIDQVMYEKNLRASVAGDAAMADAWIAGSWAVLGGVLLKFDPKVHLIRRPPYLPDVAWRVGADWGSSSVAAALLMCRLRAPLGHYPPGTVLILDETDTAVDAGLRA